MHIRTELRPGDVGYITYLHGVLYAQEYQLDHTFEGYVAAGLGEFAKTYDARKDFVAIAEDDNRIVGSIAIVGQKNNTGQLRWFLLHPDARGRGLGQQLVTAAVNFCRERGFDSVCLWTITGLDTAIHIYRKVGFTLTEEVTHEIWGAQRTEQRYDLSLE